MYSSKVPISVRPSNIPVTVKKANLFTPQTTKRPYQSGASTAGKSYMSLMTTDRKQQRMSKPAPDRDQQIMMFDGLVDFIMKNAPQLPLPEAKKFFSSVSTTESTRIFQFLLSRILPDFKVNKLEIDVPEALSILEYPYIRSVTKSSLVSVTTRQAVVGLLSIFYWLIEEIDVIKKIEEETEPNLEFGSDDPELCQLKMRFLLGQDSCVDKKQFDELHPAEDPKLIMDKLELIDQQNEDLQAQLEEIEELSETLQCYDVDIKKCDDYINQMQPYLDNKRKEEEEEKMRGADIAMRLEEKKKLNNDLSFEIQSHEFRLEEVKRYQEMISGLEARLSQVVQSCERSEAELEQFNKVKERVINKCQPDEITLMMKKMLQIYDSQPDLNSDSIEGRRKELREWIQKLETMEPRDFAHSQRDLSMLLQKFRATATSMESELKAQCADDMLRLKTEKTNYTDLTSEVARLREAIKRVEKETDKIKQQDNHKLQEISEQSGQLDKQITTMQELFVREQQALSDEIIHQSDVLRGEQEENAKSDELNSKHLQSVLERNRQEMIALVQDKQRQAEWWTRVRDVSRENNKVAMRASKLLKKKLDF